MESVHVSSGNVGKSFRSKNFSPCEDIRLCRTHVHISQDPIQDINQTSATFLQIVADHFNSLEVNNCKSTQKSLESRWGLIQRKCNIYNGYYLNVKALNESGTTEVDIQQKTQVMYKEAQKTIFDNAGNLRDKQPFRFMHCWLYLKDNLQWFYRDPARGVQNSPNKRRAFDIDLTIGEGQAGQGSGGSPTGEYNDRKDKKNAKIARLNQDLHMAVLKSATEAFKLMNESSAEKARVLNDANDNALFSRPGRQPDTISEVYFKLREEQTYLERQKYVMKLRKELPRSTQGPLVITYG